MSNREQSIQRALNELETGLFPPTHKVTEYPHAGRLSVARTDRKSQRLSKEEEKVLIQYFGDLQRQNLCPISLEFDELSPEILQNSGDHKTLRKHYVTRFIQRHPELKTGKTRAMGVKRLTALDPTIIVRFFTEFERLRSDYKVEIEDIYDLGETGLQLG
jgi:hypothetical protein